MSGFQIESAGTNSHGMLVNAKGQAQTRSVTLPRITEATVKGRAFYIHSGFVSLTSTGSFNGIAYIKNTSQLNMNVHSIRTCGEMVQQWELYRNPTTGTLISSGSAKIPQNLNFSSGGVFNGTVLAGADGYTITDGNLLAHWINPVGHSTEELQGSLILGPNNTMALQCKPASSGNVCIAILVDFESNG